MSMSVFISALEIGPPYVGSLAGTRRYAYSLVQSLANQEITIYVVSSNKLPEKDKLLEKSNIIFYTIEGRKKREEGFRKRRSSIRRDERYFSRKAFKLYQELEKAKSLSLIHTMDLAAISFLKAKKNEKIKTPIIISISNPIIASGLRKNLVKYANKIIYSNKKASRRSFPGKQALEKRSSIIPLSINCKNIAQIPKLEELEKFRSKYDLNQEKETILLLGPFIPRKLQKNIIDYFPQIINKYPDVTFMIAGEGPELSIIKQKLIQLNIDQYTSITGYLPDNELQLAYHSSSLLLYPAESGSFGTPVIEAMAAGLPIIAANKPPMNELINEENLYTPSEKHEMVSLVSNILENKENSQKLSFELQKHALKTFDYTVVGKKLMKLYKETLS